MVRASQASLVALRKRRETRSRFRRSDADAKDRTHLKIPSIWGMLSMVKEKSVEIGWVEEI